MASANRAQASVDNAPTNAEKMRLLHWNHIRSAANTFFTQFTFFGPAFILFLNELNLNKTQIGLLLSIFPFMGAVSFFLAPSVGRYGYKRTWITFFGLRKVVTILLLFVPYVASRYGAQIALYYVGSIVLLFGLCRAISETGLYPWLTELVPNAIRGRYNATQNLINNFVGLIAVTIASFVVDSFTGLGRFTFLFAAGIVFGFVAVWASSFSPGGASTRGTDAENISQKDILKSLRDSNYLRFIIGLGLVTLATAPMFSFLPLFMREQIGLSDGNVILLQNGTLVGALSATYIAGWASDRYGSKPVMLSGLWLMLLLPIAWLIMPRGVVASLPIALSIAFLQGIGTVMWGIGSSRMLYVSIIPIEQKAQYMGSYYALVGIIGGVSQLIGGRVLESFSNLSSSFSFLTIDSYTPLFILGFTLILTALILFRFIKADTDVRTSEFAGMFLQGNLFMAFESMFRFYRAKDEQAAIVATERLGQAHSLFTIDELLESLQDPRFFVRFEAVVSIARSDPPDPRYVDALTQILQGTELSLTVLAAWALGRIGDKQAREALREGLNSDYRSIRAHCARALGALSDTRIVPELLERLNHETDIGLRMAYASSLGSIPAPEGIQPIMDLLLEIDNQGARNELALSLARIVGDEQQSIRILRQLRQETGTNASHLVFALGQKVADLRSDNPELDTLFHECINAFAQEDLNKGIDNLVEILSQVNLDDALSENAQVVLTECREQLAKFGSTRIEYLVLTFDLLSMV